MRKFVAAIALLSLGLTIGLGVTSWSEESHNVWGISGLPWAPFATNAQGQQKWVVAPGFQTHSDCIASLPTDLESQNNNGLKAPYGCAYYGNNYYYTYLVNWLYDGKSFAGCLAKRIVTYQDSGDRLYHPTLISTGMETVESGKTWYCVGWWTDPDLLRSSAKAQQVSMCQQHIIWDGHPDPEYVAQFNSHCAELGVKTNCKLVQQQRHPIDDLDRMRQDLMRQAGIIEYDLKC